jgi:hypothetical protein
MMHDTFKFLDTLLEERSPTFRNAVASHGLSRDIGPLQEFIRLVAQETATCAASERFTYWG